MSKRKKPLVVRDKKTYTPFPPAQTPRKVDLQIESGEFFLNETQRENKRKAEKIATAKEKSQEKRELRAKEFEAPVEDDEDDLTEEKQLKKKKRKREQQDEGIVEGDIFEDNSSKKKKKSKKREHAEE